VKMVAVAGFIREFPTVDPDIHRSWDNPGRTRAPLLRFVGCTGIGEGYRSLYV